MKPLQWNGLGLVLIPIKLTYIKHYSNKEIMYIFFLFSRHFASCVVCTEMIAVGLKQMLHRRWAYTVGSHDTLPCCHDYLLSIIDIFWFACISGPAG